MLYLKIDYKKLVKKVKFIKNTRVLNIIQKINLEKKDKIGKKIFYLNKLDFYILYISKYIFKNIFKIINWNLIIYKIFDKI